ncbi:hypothetical protein Tco_0710625 [Tanacetum coccineum]
MRIDLVKTQKEPTYQVVLDALALTTCYPAFLITADVPKVYMQQFWFTINKKDSTTYRFKIDKKRYIFDMEVFREIFQICLRLPKQDFDELPSYEEIVSFIKELSHKGNIISITDVTYLAYATGTATPKKARKFKRSASPSKKRTLVIVDEEEPKPAKKVVSSQKPSRKQPAGINLLSDVAALEAAQLKKVLKRSKQDTSIHQVCGLGDGTGSKPGVPDEPKGKSVDTNKGTDDDDDVLESDDDLEHSDDERTDSENQKSTEEDEESDDMFVHTPEDYVPTDDETNNEAKGVDEEEYERIQRELYHDVNVRLTYAEQDDEGKEDVEITNATQIATTKLQLVSSNRSVSSTFTNAMINLENLNAVISTIKSEVPNAVKEFLGTNLDDALYKVLKKHDANIIKEFSVLAEIVERLTQQYLPQQSIKKSTKEIQKIKLEHASKQQRPKDTITSDDTDALEEFDQKTTLFKIMTKTKSFNKSPKHRALYHALMQSIIKDENAMDKGVVDQLKKRKLDDAEKNEGPFVGSDRGLKRQKTSKDTKPSKKAKSTETSKGTSKSQLYSTGKSVQAEETVFEARDTQGPQNLGEDTGNTDALPVVNVDPKDWFKKPKRPLTPDPKWNEGKSVENKPTQKWLSDFAKAEKPSKSFDDLMSTLIDFSAFFMNRRLQISDLT